MLVRVHYYHASKISQKYHLYLPFFLHFNFLIALWILSIVMGLLRNCNKSDWPFSPFSLLSFGDDLTSFTLHIIHVIVVKIVDMRRVDLFFKIFHKLWQGRTFGWISRFWRFPEFPVGIWIFCFHIYKLTKFDLLVVYLLFFGLIVYIVVTLYYIHLAVC